jgi:hypothetical protein
MSGHHEVPNLEVGCVDLTEHASIVSLNLGHLEILEQLVAALRELRDLRARLGKANASREPIGSADDHRSCASKATGRWSPIARPSWS